MPPVTSSRYTALLIVVFAFLLAAAPAGAAGFGFTVPQQLAHGDPNGKPYYAGGEPSIAFDPTGDGHVYVTAPQGVPAVLGPNPQGVAYWASSDHARSFPLSGLTGSLTGGGDSDVAVDGAHSVFVADLEATASAICTSHDFAHTFPDCEAGLAQNQQGPEDDREWLTVGNRPGVLYLTYHDFAGGFPIIERSTDGGKSFAPCGTILQPGSDAANNYSPVSGTLVSKPVVDPGTGTVYVEFSEPDRLANPASAAIDHLYMAVAPGGCNGGTTFADYDIYSNPGASLAHIFQATARDGGGELYVLAAGNTTSANANRADLWLFRSTDGGRTWSAPETINPPSLAANALPALAAGPGRGEFLAGWFGTSVSGDTNNTKDVWRYYAAESFDGGQTVAYTTVSPNPLHYQDICTAGVFCGAPGQPSNRNLFDFSSAAIDPSNGCGTLAIPGDPYNNVPGQANPSDNFDSSAYVSLETSGCLTAAQAGTAVSQSTTAGSGCLDRAAPRARFKSKRVASSQRRISLRGVASDRGCGPHGRGKVARVLVSIARVSHGRCRFLGANGRFGRPQRCADAHDFRARGTNRWKLNLGGRFGPGVYRLWVHAVDAAGNVGRPVAARVAAGAAARHAGDPRFTG
jgi:hypothetical protein